MTDYVVAHKQSFDKANEWMRKAREKAQKEENEKKQKDATRQSGV